MSNDFKSRDSLECGWVTLLLRFILCVSEAKWVKWPTYKKEENAPLCALCTCGWDQRSGLECDHYIVLHQETPIDHVYIVNTSRYDYLNLMPHVSRWGERWKGRPGSCGRWWPTLASWKHSPMTVVILTTAKRLTHDHTGAWRGANMSAHLEVIRIFCKQVGQLGCPKKKWSRNVWTI